MDPQTPNLSTQAPEIPTTTSELPKKDNHGITIAAMAVFVLLSLAAIAFLYYQNQQLKSMFPGSTNSNRTNPTSTTFQTPNSSDYSRNVFKGVSDEQGYLPEVYFMSEVSGTSKSGGVIGPSKQLSGWNSFVNQTTGDALYYFFERNSKNISLEQYLKSFSDASLNQPSGFLSGNSSPILINENPGYRADLDNIKTTYEFLKNPNTPTIAVFKYSWDNVNQSSIFDTISTFKYIEKPASAGSPSASPVACTEEAKLCPDGSSVGRVGPNCEFAPCP